MSEDDRAAKAARAKAMLKKRQQKKAGAEPPPSAVNVTSSPVNSTEFGELREKGDLGDVFGKADSDSNWISSLPRVGSPPPPASSSPQITLSQKDITTELRSQIQSQQQTINLLVSEKASLAASLEKLDDIKSKNQEKDAVLHDEYDKSQALEGRVRQLQAQSDSDTIQIRQLEEKEKALTERSRELERELQLTNGTVSDLRTEASQYGRRVRELEEQIQSDDRVERLESSLKNNQDRADELEFQLSKLKQMHTALKTERDEIESQLRLHRDGEREWRSNHEDLHVLHSNTQQELLAVTTSKNELLQEKSALHSQIGTAQRAFSELENKLTVAVTELATNSRQLHGVQAELRNANRRAEEAEKTQRDLQTEGTNLMRSLDEMRPKIVELTGVKLELGEKVDALEHVLRSRDATILQLESTVDEITQQKDDAQRQKADILAMHRKERSFAAENSTELQKAFTELQSDFELSRASVLTLEAERSHHHQVASRQLEEIDRLTNLSRAQAEELSYTHRESEEFQVAREEHEGFLEVARNEIELLRAELAAKEEEIGRLQQAISSSPSPTAGHQSLDGEMLSALRQQHALDLSAAHSNIRALETSVFEAEARSHALQKQVSTLEDELAQSHKASRAIERSFSPRLPSRPSSRISTQRNGIKVGNLGPPPTRSMFDHDLPAETRHKRRVSLSMLKARIDSEVAAASTTSHPPSRIFSQDPNKHEASILPTVTEPRAEPEWSPTDHSFKRPRFLDESHIFWCTSCRGDLVIL